MGFSHILQVYKKRKLIKLIKIKKIKIDCIKKNKLINKNLRKLKLLKQTLIQSHNQLIKIWYVAFQLNYKKNYLNKINK